MMTGGTRFLGRNRETRVFNIHPMYATIVFFSLLAVYSFGFKRAQTTAPTTSSSLLYSPSEDCRSVHAASDQCAFVRRNCHDEEAGLFEYLTFYYCRFGHVQPVAFIILVLWLGLLFTTIGIAASDFFSINLSTIASFLGLSESLAGVTFLAFGNGSPDVFSTFAAMSSNSGSMAVGELIGAASFISTVVAGSMALVCEFKVARKTFVRDICFFIVAVTAAVAFLFDGLLHLWECSVMIGFYLFYVAVVVSWHTCSGRRRTHRAKEAAARGHVYRNANASGNDELEPYRDAPDDENPSVSIGHVPVSTDIRVLEQGPLIEIRTPSPDGDYDSDQSRQVAAEMTSSMRVNRPRGRRSASTITPIRPSLVGALEFRSVLASLQRDGNMHMRPIHTRSRSTNHLDVPDLAIRGPTRSPGADDHDTSSPTRGRALSSGAVPNVIDSDIARRRIINGNRRQASHTIGGRLAPPLTDGLTGQSLLGQDSPLLHRLQVTSPSTTEASTHQLSALPRSTDSPLVMSPSTQQSSNVNISSLPVRLPASLTSLAKHVSLKCANWWPHSLLPSPRLMLGTLFPTMHGWRTKTIWDKFVSVISAPSIFLLVITLPVVESEMTADDTDDIAEPSTLDPSTLDPSTLDPSTLDPSRMSPRIPGTPNESTDQETEWMHYRRSINSGKPSRSPSPSLTSPGDSQIAAMSNETLTAAIPPALEAQLPGPPSDLGQDTSKIQEEDQGWNRWLLVIQIFTGPLFCVCVVWANLAGDLEKPIRDLVRAMLISLVFSFALLGVLLATTSSDRPPKYHVAFCFLGFIIAIAWISTVAGEVVGVLKAFGVILNISEAILGLTIFAIGNSIGDLVSDVTVARLGYPVMALSACFGGPLLNILLGIGLGGAYQTIQAANNYRAKHPDQPFQYRPYNIHVTGTLIISTIALLVTLFSLLVVVPMNKWMMTRKIGWGLVGLWTTSTAINLAIEITGVWEHIA
ncbi:hypothetical protein GGR50DRAFT_699722 [Xylaria sp. CBS 124048]|nr:hypothetical protein GGR50DRAFT_699722 [Xylaria sp. CBS 124048]